MTDFDRVAQWRDLCEHYRRLTDEELVALAQQKTEFTDLAQQALTSEISYRKLTVPVTPPKEPAPPPPSDGDPYAEDRELVEIAMVYSLRDAQQIEGLLSDASIPFFMGPELATSTDGVKSRFGEGVSVKVMKIAVPFVRGVLQTFEPKDDPYPDTPQDAPADTSARCPECGSAEIVLEGTEQDPDNPARDQASHFEWTCMACGHEWEDDGIEEEL